MKIFCVAAAIVLLTGLSLCRRYAQAPKMNLIPELGPKTQEEKDAEAERDKAYKESLKKIPDPKVSSDPWGDVRSRRSQGVNSQGRRFDEAEDQNRQRRKLANRNATCTLAVS